MREVTYEVVGWVVCRVTLRTYLHSLRTKEFGTFERRQYFANIHFKDVFFTM